MNVLTNGVKVDVYAKDRCLVSLMERMRTKSGKAFHELFLNENVREGGMDEG